MTLFNNYCYRHLIFAVVSRKTLSTVLFLNRMSSISKKNSTHLTVILTPYHLICDIFIVPFQITGETSELMNLIYRDSLFRFYSQCFIKIKANSHIYIDPKRAHFVSNALSLFFCVHLFIYFVSFIVTILSEIHTPRCKFLFKFISIEQFRFNKYSSYV